ncbi:hypothetical protein NX059_008701 [Plenodomus lindquistii]|nr:hypothetical protein NX059_008701 [Plenodomus lindquistii]
MSHEPKSRLRTTNCDNDTTMLAFIKRLLGRKENTLPPFNFARNRFPAQKKWPPNMRELTDKQQFRFERKFKRRIKQKAIKPTWDKSIAVIQWSSISFIVIYGVLFHDFRKDPMNPRPGEQPFEGLRARMWGMLGNFYTHTEDTTTVERGSRRTGQSPSSSPPPLNQGTGP